MRGAGAGYRCTAVAARLHAAVRLSAVRLHTYERLSDVRLRAYLRM